MKTKTSNRAGVVPAADAGIPEGRLALEAAPFRLNLDVAVDRQGVVLVTVALVSRPRSQFGAVVLLV
jgi:hypothetical protein